MELFDLGWILSNNLVTHRSGKYNINADLISRATHLSEPPPSDVDSITQGKEDHFSPPMEKGKLSKEKQNPLCDMSEKLWSQVNNFSDYTPPLLPR